MQNPLMQTIEALAKEKGIEPDMIITAIEDAVLTASRKYYKTNENLKTRFNQETGQVDLFAIKHIVKEVEDPSTQISLKEAQDPPDFLQRKSFAAKLGDHGDLDYFGREVNTAVSLVPRRNNFAFIPPLQLPQTDSCDVRYLA